MQAMVLDGAGERLALREVPDPEPGPGELLLHVRACGVCRTDLHIQDGDLVLVGLIPADLALCSMAQVEVA